jgi:hypothetical protein
MKNIMIVDGADNCAYDVFAATDEEFALLFPGEGQDIAFIDEIVAALPEADSVTTALWARPVEKRLVKGIHGTIFYELERKKQYYPNRRDSDLDGWARAWHHAGNEGNDLRHAIIGQSKTTAADQASEED